MPFEDPGSALRDIAAAIDNIQHFTEGMDLDAFRKDLKTIAGVERMLLVISEAAIRLKDEAAKLCPGALLVTDQDKAPRDWTPHGNLLLYTTQDPKTASDLWVLPMDGGHKPFPIAQSSFDEIHGQISPDGHWLAFAANENGQYEVYVQAFPKSVGKQQVSTGGGICIYPRRRRDGRELYYVTLDNRVMAVPVQTSPDPAVITPGTPTVFFRTQMAVGAVVGIAGALSRAQYAVAPDGRFLMLLNADMPLVPINIAVNWATALRR